MVIPRVADLRDNAELEDCYLWPPVIGGGRDLKACGMWDTLYNLRQVAYGEDTEQVGHQVSFVFLEMRSVLI